MAVEDVALWVAEVEDRPGGLAHGGPLASVPAAATPAEAGALSNRPPLNGLSASGFHRQSIAAACPA